MRKYMRKTLARSLPTKESRICLLAGIHLALAAGFALGRLSAPKAEARARGPLAGSISDTVPLLQAKPRPRCTVVRVVDGDTLVVRSGDATEHVRLLRIDAPERGERGFRESKDALRTARRRSQERRPRTARASAVVFFVLQSSFFALAVSGARFWTKYGAGRLAEDFRRAEAQARAARRGLWAPQR